VVTRDASPRHGGEDAPGGAVMAAGLAALTLGVAVLTGWATGAQLLLRLRPELPAMQPTTAVCFVCLGVALVAVAATGHRLRRVMVPAALAAAAVAALSLADRAGLHAVSVEHLLFAGAVARDPNRGAMAAVTALLVLLLSAALVVLATAPPGHELAAQILGLAALTGSVLAVLDHLYGDQAPYLGNVRSVMAAHTAVGLTLASAGILASVPGGLVPRVLHERGPGSTLRRRLLAVVAIALPTLGWLRLEGERLGLYGTSFGLAVIVAVAGAMVYAAAWSATDVADRSGAMLRDAWHRLGSTNADLERRVAAQAAELAVTRARLRGVLEVLGDVAPLVVTHADGRVAMASARAVELLGRTEAELAGQPLDALSREVRRTVAGGVHLLAEDAVDVTVADDAAGDATGEVTAVTRVGDVALERDRG
jgi:PAS domain-containing protein